ncbi:MAG: hypothetical protein E7338_05670 [Clostridiales bacterium]|nr:hypothetical protein [Clostridiales bacterium]
MELTLKIQKDGKIENVRAYDALMEYVNSIPDEEIKGHFGADVKDRRKDIIKYVEAIAKDEAAVTTIQNYYDYDKGFTQHAIINTYLYEIVGD